MNVVVGSAVPGAVIGAVIALASSVVATATTYGPAAANHAIVVKLVRTLTIIPICLDLAALTTRRQQAKPAATPARQPEPARMSPLRVVRLVPWFLIGFVAAAGLNSAGLIPSGSHGPLQHGSVFLVAVALSAIGLSTNVPALRTAGPQAGAARRAAVDHGRRRQPGPADPHRHPSITRKIGEPDAQPSLARWAGRQS